MGRMAEDRKIRVEKRNQISLYTIRDDNRWAPRYFRAVSPAPPYSYFFLYRLRKNTYPLNLMIAEKLGKKGDKCFFHGYSHRVVNIPFALFISDVL